MSMPLKLKPSLADPYLKATRSKEHLDALRDQLDLFYKTKPYTFFHEDDFTRGRHCVRVELKPFPDRVYLIAGDLLYCLRSALDQTVFALAHLTIRYPEGTQFPILDTDIALDRNVKKRFEKQTAGVPAAAVRIIESLQPYHVGDAAAIKRHLLWRLNWLGNIDKHRRIPLHGQEIIFTFPQLPKSAASFMELDHDNGICSLPVTYKDQMALDPNVSFKLVFGDLSEGIACDFDGIEKIHNFVAGDVIPRFTRFFT
jgi:hypothetical protein